MDRCDWTLEHIANDLKKRQPKDLREESLRRPTLLRAHADNDIAEVLRVVALTIPSGSGSEAGAIGCWNAPTGVWPSSASRWAAVRAGTTLSRR